MHSEAISQVSNYLQPDSLELEKNTKEMIDQNPLLLLARTCQNIGNESNYDNKSPNSSTISNSMNGYSDTSKMMNYDKDKEISSSSPNNIQYNDSNKLTNIGIRASFSPIPDRKCGKNQNESCFQGSPSSNSLIQLARLSSRLSSTRQRHKPDSAKKIIEPIKQLKRKRHDTFCSTKDDATILNKSNRVENNFFESTNRINFPSKTLASSASTPTSPNSTNSTPIMRGSPKSCSFESSLTEKLPSFISCLEQFYSIGNTLGLSKDRLTDFISLIIRILFESLPKSTESLSNCNLEPGCDTILPMEESNSIRNERVDFNDSCKPTIYSNSPLSNDPSTQCLYCGMKCVDIAKLVQHIYSHLASLHSKYDMKDTFSPIIPIINPSMNNNLHEMLGRHCGHSLQNLLVTDEFSNPNHSKPQTSIKSHSFPLISDTNSFLMAWMDILHSNFNGPISLTKDRNKLDNCM